MDFNNITDIDMILMSHINGSESLFLDRLMVFLTSALTWVPLYLALLLIIFRNFRTRQAFMLILFAAVMVGVSDLFDNGIIKPMFMRPRPSHDPHVAGLIDITSGIRAGAYGFFSAHASNTMCLAVFFSLIMRSGLLSVFLITWSLVNCYTRMYLGVHYPSDILCGIICGMVLAFSTYYAFTCYMKKNFSKHFISSNFSSSGIAYIDIELVMMTLAATLLVGIFYAICWQ